MGRRSKRKKLLLRRNRLLGIELDPQGARRVGLGHIIDEKERIKAAETKRLAEEKAIKEAEEKRLVEEKTRKEAEAERKRQEEEAKKKKVVADNKRTTTSKKKTPKAKKTFKG